MALRKVLLDVFIASTSTPSTTFARSLYFIDNQECSDITFGSNLPPLQLTASLRSH